MFLFDRIESIGRMPPPPHDPHSMPPHYLPPHPSMHHPHHHRPPRHHVMPPMSRGHSGSASYDTNNPTSQGATYTTPASGEPWLAAQNLTFLKRGSPSSASAEKKKKSSVLVDHGEIGSMPSLASSSEGTSPGDMAVTSSSSAVATTPTGRKEDNAVPGSAADAGVNTLLLAAYAMTEFGQAKESSEEKKDFSSSSSTPTTSTPARKTSSTTKRRTSPPSSTVAISPCSDQPATKRARSGDSSKPSLTAARGKRNPSPAAAAGKSKPSTAAGKSTQKSTSSASQTSKSTTKKTTTKSSAPPQAVIGS